MYEESVSFAISCFSLNVSSTQKTYPNLDMKLFGMLMFCSMFFATFHLEPTGFAAPSILT